MAEFRFFGTETILPGGTALSRYGQVVEMETAAANALIVASPPALLLPADLWEAIFAPGPETEAELAKWPSATIHATAPPEATNAPAVFLEKTARVRMAFHLYRADLLTAAAGDAGRKVASAPEPFSEPKAGPVNEPAADHPVM